jgi:hypothetical protein
MRLRTFVPDLALAAAMTLSAALADAQPAPPPIPESSKAKSAAASPPTEDCGQCGRVVSIRQTAVKDTWTPLGTGVGVGGAPDFGPTPSAVTSFRIGPGLSNQGMVVVGAAGGASYQKTPNSYNKPQWEVTVKLDSGQSRITMLAYEPYFQEGDRVRIMGRNVELVD